MNCTQTKRTALEPPRPVVHGQPSLLAQAGCALVLATPDNALAQRLARELAISAPGNTLTVAPTLARLRELLKSALAGMIFLDSDLLGGLAILDTVRQLCSAAPVLVLGSLNSQADIAKLVGDHRVDFVARVGDFVPLTSALLSRRLKQPAAFSVNWAPAGADIPSNLAEIFRHEINNPLTGILGNAELVLAHPENLSRVEVQRLQTVVDLAIRLRESIRRISNAWERREIPREPA